VPALLDLLHIHGILKMNIFFWIINRFSWINVLSRWFMEFWRELSPETKRELIETIVRYFQAILHKYYQYYKNSKDKNEDF